MARNARVIVFTWLKSVGLMIDEELHRTGFDTVFPTTWTLEALSLLANDNRSGEVIVIIDRGATQKMQDESNQLALKIRKIRPSARLLRIGAEDDFPKDAKDGYWCKFGFDFESLGKLATKMITHAA